LDIDLTNAGFTIDRVSNYTTSPVEEIDKNIIDLLKKKSPDAIFVYSSKSAKNLFNLINKYSLLNVVTKSNLMCISEKVLSVLKQIKWKKVFVFSPGEEEFLLNKIRYVMDIFENFSTLFLEVWKKGILGIDIFQISIGLGIFLIFLLFRGLISKVIIGRLKKIAARTTNKLDDTFVQAMEGPARFFPIVIGFFIASYYLEFSPESQSFIDNVNKSLITILIFWLIHQFIQPVTYLLGGLEKILTRELIGWIVKALKILIFILG